MVHGPQVADLQPGREPAVGIGPGRLHDTVDQDRGVAGEHHRECGEMTAADERAGRHCLPEKSAPKSLSTLCTVTHTWLYREPTFANVVIGGQTAKPPASRISRIASAATPADTTAPSDSSY
jgi:hypothetical protein